METTVDLVYSFLDRVASDTGEVPSIRQIREQIGRGSLDTIAKAVKSWKTSRGLPTKVKENIGLDEDATRALIAALMKVLNPIINAKITSEKAPLEKTIESLNKALKDAHIELRELSQDFQAARREIDELKSALDKERINRAKAQGALEALMHNKQFSETSGHKQP